MDSLKKFLQVLILVVVIMDSHQQVKIKCYDCVTPIGVTNAEEHCNQEHYCQGFYCTKGPNSITNGIYRGCSNTPPLDKAGATCKKVTNSLGEHSNCYCKNVEFCNDSTSILGNQIALIIILIALTFFFIFAQ